MNESETINVSNHVLVWAREALALNKTDAAERTSIPINRLTQLEEGEKQPTLGELKAFSKEYKRTIATLLLTKPPEEKPLPSDRRTVDSNQLGMFHEKSILAIRKARAMANALIELKTDAGNEIPKFKFSANINESPQEVAKRLRAEINLDEVRVYENINDALEAYIEKIEALGVAIFQLSLTQDNLRGFSIVDEDIPIIGIKRGGESPTAKNFTLFHELGHLLLNEGGICDLSFKSNIAVEKWCNEFAAEILIPKEELLQTDTVQQHQASNEMIWSKTELVELGSKFHVGPLAILRSLKELNLTTSSFYNEKHDAWNKPQFGRAKKPEGRNIPKETIKEKGKSYVWLAFNAYDQNRINLKDLSDFLGVRLSYISKTRQLLDSF
jgi:Zn-dependent peptidase ImmA (M78 family)